MALTDNLVAYYSLDESSGNAVDATGNGFTMTNNGTTAFAAALINNGADYGTTNSTKSFQVNNDLGIAGGAITISTWVKLRTEISSGIQGIAIQGDAGTDVNYIIAYDYNGGTRRLQFNRQKQSVSNNITNGTATLGTAGWNYIVLTYDGTNVAGWLNGTQVASDLSTSGSGSAGAFDMFRIGGNDNQYTNLYISAYQDETGIWSRALTSTEIADLYNGGAGFAYPFSGGGGGGSTRKGLALLGVGQ